MSHAEADNPTHYRACPAQANATEDGLFLRSPVTGEWLKLDGPARAVWERLEYPTTLAEAADRLAQHYEAPSAEIEAGVRDVVARLAPLGLFEAAAAGDPLRHRYLRLLKRALLNLLYPELELRIAFMEKGGGGLSGLERARHLRDIAEREPEALASLEAGKLSGGPLARGAHTMIGLFRLNNLERCAEAVFADRVEGDFLEAGVCQGGASIFMRALQVVHGQAGRRMWVVDSFQGVPPSATEEDRRYGLHLEESREPWLACSEARVREHFARYDMLDEQVGFVAGWVAETLPAAPIGPLAILRIDVDLYSATAECLDLLYDKVSPGGFVIVDDYGFFDCCRDAVDHFRARRGILDPIEWIDQEGIFWRKDGAGAGVTAA